MSDIVLGIKITADGKGAKDEISGTANELGKLEDAGNRAKNGLDGAGKGADEARRHMESAARAAGALVGAFVGLSAAAIARAFVQSADAIKGIDARIKLVSGTAAEYQRGIQGITDISYRYNQQLDDTAKLYARIAPVAQDLHRSQADVLKVMSGVGAAMRVSNASAAEQSSTITQLTQTLSSATAQWEDFGQLQDTAPALVRAVEKELSSLVAQHGSLKAAMAAGAVTQEQFFDTLVKVAPEFERQAATIDGPVSGSLTNLKTSLVEASAAMDKVLGVTSGLSEMLNGLAGAGKKSTDFWKAALPSSDAGDQVAAFRARIISLKGELESERTSWFPDEQKMARLEQEIAGMEAAYVRLKQSAQESANAGTESFQGLGYSLQDVGRKQEATISALSAAAKKYGIPENVLVTVAKLESNFDQLAVSAKGALGVMQLMPATAKELGVNARDAMQNIDGGARYLKKMLDRFKNDLPSALAAYNMGPGNFQRYGLGSQAAQDYLAAYDKAAKELKAKYPNGLLADVLDPKEQQRLQDAARDSFVSHLQSLEQASKASAERQKAILDTQIAEREAALQRLQEASKIDIAGKTGGERTDAVQRAYDQERQALQQIALLKGQQVALDEAAARASLQNIQQQIDAADRFQLTEAQRQSLQGQKMQAETALSVLAEQRAQREIEAGQKIARAYDAVAEAKSKQNSDDQQAIAALDTYIAQLDEKIRALAEGNQLLSEEAALRKLIAGLPAGIDAGKQIEQAEKQLQQYKELTKAAGDKKKAEQAVSDDILRQGQYYQAMSQMAQKAAAGMAEAFGETGKALGGMVVAIADANQYMFQIQQQTAAQIKSINDGAGTKDEKEQKIRSAEMQGQTQELAAQLNLYGSLATAAQGFFEKGSSGYKAMQTASQAFHAAELAASIAATAQKAVEAITTQASAGPYIGFALMAAMAAALGAIGAFSGGVSASAPSSTSMKEQSKGTVLGNSDAVSESLKNSLDRLEKTNSADLAYSAQMTRSLKNIEASLTGVTASLLLNVNAFTALAGKFSAGQGKIKDYGIGFPQQSIADILGAGGFDVRAYTKGTPTGGSTGTYVTAAGKEVSREFTLVIQGIVDALNAGAKSFGVSGEAFRQKINDFQVQFSALSLRDDKGKALKGDELKAAIEGYFSSVADQITSSLHIDGLEQFQVAGEGLFETFVRLAGSIDESKTKLAALGVAAIDYRDIELKRAQDLSAEIARQSIVAKEGNSAIGTYIQDAVGSIDDLIEAYKGLLHISDQMKTFGLDANNLTRDMVNAAGGVKALASSMDSFASSFLSEGGQLSAELTTLARQFGDFGVVLPKSKDEFRKLIEGIDTSSKSGQELFGHLISLSEALSKAADQAKRLNDLYLSYTDPLSKYKDTIQKVVDDFKSILDGKLGEISAYYDSLAMQQKTANDKPYQDVIGGLTGISSARQQEIDINLGNLKATNERITQLQGLLAQWSGAKGAAGYVAAWQQELEELQKNAEALKSNILSSTNEINNINAEIKRLTDQMNSGDASIDATALQQKLAALDEQKKQILKAEGDALLQTLRDVWKQMIDAINQARRSLDQQIATLRGGPALADYSMQTARASFKSAVTYGGNDPSEAIRRIQLAQSDIMVAYQARMDLINKEIQAQTEIINQQADILIKKRQAQAQADIDAINVDADAQIEASKKAADAQIQAINDATDARIKAIGKEQDAAMSALQKKQDAEMKALNDQLNNARALSSAIKQIAEYAKSLKIGNLSSLSPQDQLAESKRQYEQLLAKARGGDADAMAKLQGASQNYLELAQKFFGSGASYAEIFKQVQAAMEALGNMKAPSEESVQAKIDQLKDQQKKEQDALREQFQARTDEARKQANAQITAINDAEKAHEDAIRKAADAQIKSVQDAADFDVAEIRKKADQMIRDLSDPEKNLALKLLREQAINALMVLRDKLDEQEKLAREHGMDLINEVRNLGILNTAQLEQLNKMAEKMGAQIVPKYASGGMASAGWAMVGEVGPELIRLNAPNSQVYSTDQTRRVLGNDNKEELRALRAEMRAVVKTNSAAYPEMIRALQAIEARLSALERDKRVRPAA